MKIDEKKLELELARKCMNTTELSRAAGIHRRTVWRIMQGESASTVVVGKIAQALGVDILDIIEWKKI